MTLTTVENWRRRGLGDGELTPQQMVIYRLIKHKGPVFTVQVILELCKGPAIDPTQKHGIENDLKLRAEVPSSPRHLFDKPGRLREAETIGKFQHAIIITM